MKDILMYLIMAGIVAAYIVWAIRFSRQHEDSGVAGTGMTVHSALFMGVFIMVILPLLSGVIITFK